MVSRMAACAVALALAASSVAPMAVAGPGSQPEVRYQFKEMIRGAQIHGANGLAVDTDGHLLVASVFGSEIVVVDPLTGAISDRVRDDVDGPDDVAIGPDGSVYWTDILAGEVGRRTPDGAVSKQLVAPGVNPIAFTDDGRLFVAQAFFGDGLYELDPDLVDAPRVVIPDSTTAPFVSQLNGFDVGPDGMLYAPQPILSRIVRIDLETGDLEVVADGLAAGPSSVEFDAEGRLFASLFDGRVVAVEIETGSVDTRATIPGATLDNMVFDTAGRLFVSDSDDGAVYVIARGRGVRTLVKGGLILPGGVAVMPDAAGSESLFVADLWSLSEFDARSGRLIDIDSQSRFGPGIVESWTVAPDDGDVVLTSWMSNAVQIWDPVADEPVETFYDFAVPLNALRFQGDLVAAELGTGSIVSRDADGHRTTLLDGLFVPSGLAATETDLWAADWATGLVWHVAGDGAPRIVAGGLAQPEGMAVDRDGSLLVVESALGRLSRIDPTTDVVSIVVDGLVMDAQSPAGIPPTFVMSSVTVDSHGTVFVSGAGAEQNVVYRVRAVPAS